MSDPQAPSIRPGRLDPETIAENFADLHEPLQAHEANVEADRCYFCYDAPCMQACPTSIDIPLFIRQISTGQANGAAKTILSSNIMGGMCARVCPTETLCEEVCVRETAEGEPVKIGELQRYATDHLMETQQAHPFERAPDTGKHIAVVGAGPAGLSCAHKLAQLGHKVTILEARDKPGGLNEHGIAAYKSTNDFAAREVDFILGIGGIAINKGVQLGTDAKLSDLANDHDAVFLAMGLGDVSQLNIDGEDASGVEDAVRYIETLRQSKDLSKLPVGRHIIVIGGGMTAIDVAVQTKHLGAETVTICYRRGAEDMNASDFEQVVAQTAGVTIRHHLQPKRIDATDGHVTGIEMEYTTQNGSLKGTGETLVLPADQIFKAIGQKFASDPLAGTDFAMENGRIAVDENHRTSMAGVWAGGDCIAGDEDLTVVAVEHGKVAATDIHKSLTAT